MTIDYTAGTQLTESVAACTDALLTLQRFGKTADAEAPLTDAEAASSTYANIAADGSRSDSYKLQAAARAYSSTMTLLATRLTAQANLASAQYRADAANVFGVSGLPGDAASLVISRRDAGDRIANVFDSIVLQRLLATATLQGDEPMARAIVEQAIINSDRDTTNAFAADRPQLADAVERLWAYQQHGQPNTVDVINLWRLGSLKPPALQAKQDYEISAIANGQTAAGSWNA